ncbi:MAG: hypothetical protein HFI51_07925 [Lachnospiraceae bacterium]|jgi:hypothetical protein|nr:hypothetical protein [Lachnospiraceae bacterium]
MYYRKYFEGDVGGATAETAIVTFGACTTKYTVYVNQSRVIGHAIEEVLRDAGMNAYYDDDSFILYPDRSEGLGIGIIKGALLALGYVIYASDSTYVNFNQPSASLANQPFDTGGNYKFYVSIIGEPKGWLRVHIGTYNAPASMSYGFGIGYGKDIRDNRRVGYLVMNPTNATSAFYVRHTDDGSLVDGIIYSGMVKFSAAAVTGQTNMLVLINAYDSSGYLTMDNCYLGCQALTSGATSFYMINGVEYYYPNNSMLIKCISKVSIVE